MKIILIGPGIKEIPPKGWGAVESVVWDYYSNLIKLNHDVIIINNKNLQDVIEKCNSEKPDVVHIMYDDHIIIAPHIKCKLIFYTSHYAYLTHPNFVSHSVYYFRNIFSKVIHFKDYIHINAISKEIKDIYIRYGFPQEKINVIHNGSREDQFKFIENPNKGGKSIYIAKIEKRKRQYKYQNIDNIDFVGNYDNSSFDVNNANYIGHWNKNKLYNNLSNYGNLILLSDGEADPLVVKEGLIAGLGVVISECASANLDLTKDYIDVIPNDKLDDMEYITDIIEKNRKKSLEMRKEIREYGLNTFSWKNVIDEYNKLLLKLCKQ